MATVKKKRLFNALRAMVCVAALWLVVQGVTLNDHVKLADASPDLVGRVLSVGQSVRVELVNREVREIRRNDVAVDAEGTLRITYGLKTTWRGSVKWLLALAMLIHFPVVFPQAMRFRCLLGAQGIRVGFWECVKLSFAGNFLNFATPLGSHAGDAFKAYFASLHTDRKTEAVTTVVLDRFIGLGTLLLVAALITTLSPGGSRLALLRPYMLGLIGVGGIGTVIYLSPLLRRFRIPEAWLARLPLLKHVKRIDNAARTLAGHTSVLVSAVLITALLQAMALLAYFTVARALAMDAHPGNILEYFAYFYTGTVVQALPGPPQGLGTVELAYRYFFASYGSPSQIVCMALAIRVVVLACALPGLLVTLTGSYKPKDLADLLDAAEGTAEPQRAAEAGELVGT